MEKVILRVHSFIDVITNSSTEIYVEATSNTVQSVKTLINSLFSLAGSKLICDDVFIISLEDRDGNSDYDFKSTDLLVEVKENMTSEEAKIAARILSGLTDIFNIEACYNG